MNRERHTDGDSGIQRDRQTDGQRQGRPGHNVTGRDEERNQNRTFTQTPTLNPSYSVSLTRQDLTPTPL